MTGSRFVWHDLVTPDAEAAKAFYGELFGWTFTPWDAGGTEYPTITVGDRRWGGIVAEDGVDPYWLGYVGVDDVDAVTGRVRERGGAVRLEPEEIGEVGRCSVVTDPAGAVFALFRPRGETPSPPDRPPPGMFVWDELLTREVDAALEFYRDVVGWQSRPWDLGAAGAYHVLHAGEVQVAGATAMPEGVAAPPQWVVYVAVEDAADTLARARRLGALPFVDVTELPEVGRFATFADPQGAWFAVLEPTTSS